jgi:hypothetical protein
MRARCASTLACCTFGQPIGGLLAFGHQRGAGGALSAASAMAVFVVAC